MEKETTMHRVQLTEKTKSIVNQVKAESFRQTNIDEVINKIIVRYQEMKEELAKLKENV